MSIVGSQRNPKALLKAALLSCLAAEVFLPATTVAAQPPRHFGVRDSIEMTVFSRDPYMGKAEIEFSPDGRHISVLTKRGLLGSDQTESTIWMFDAETIRTAIERSQGVHPRLLVSMATFSTHDQVNPDPITNARWNKDGKGITFLGCNEKLGRHLFVVNVEDGHLEQLSLDGQDVTDFERAGDTLVYTTADPLSDSELYQSAVFHYRTFRLEQGCRSMHFCIQIGKSWRSSHVFNEFGKCGMAERHLWWIPLRGLRSPSSIAGLARCELFLRVGAIS